MIESMDEQAYEIQSREYNTLVPAWNHLIKHELIDNKSVRYTEEIDLYAGILTGFAAWWSSVFYRHRQKRREVILRK